MKKILETIAVILLFIISFFLFWAGLSPKTFFTFFSPYPIVQNTALKIGILTPIGEDLIHVSSSEPIIGTTGQILMDSSIWSVDIAKTDADRTQGLSNRQVLLNNTGLLFAFNNMDSHTFWMKDMLIPIDMIFFDNNWKIVLIESNLQPNSFPNIFGKEVKSQYVLEINANEAISYNLKVGDQAIFLNK